MSAIELVNHPLYNDPSLVFYQRYEGNLTEVKGNTATGYNIAYSAGPFGQCAGFNGASSRIDFANNTAFDSQSITISAWVYALNFVQNGFIFEKGSVNTQYSLFLETNGINFRTIYTGWGGTDWNLISSIVPFSESGLVHGTWNHILATIDGTNKYKYVYVNGVLRRVDYWNHTIATDTYGIRVGAYGSAAPSYWFNGGLDEVAVWTRYFTKEEQHSLFDNPRNRALGNYHRKNTFLFSGPMKATGGTELYINAKKVHKFTSSGTFSVQQSGYARILIVAAGGGAGGGIGGGGGGGAVIKIPRTFIAAGDYSIIVGIGGNGGAYPSAGTNGGNSSAFGAITYGGGASGCHDASDGIAGGSGGGAASNNARINQGGAATLGDLGGHIGTVYGNRGGHMLVARTGTPTRAAGGGGAGGAGIDTNTNTTGALGYFGGGAGGKGIEDDILGVGYYWGAGGGGGSYQTNGGSGGIGGGGGAGGDTAAGPAGPQGLNAGGSSNSPGGAGGVNTGAGGGSSIWQYTTGGAGGSGIVVISYDEYEETRVPVIRTRVRLPDTSAPVPSSFSPTSISGCRLWIDITKLTGYKDGDKIASITDLSGYSANLTQATESQKPVYISKGINDLPVIRHTAAVGTTWAIPWNYTAPNTFFYVGKEGVVQGRMLSSITTNWLMGTWSNFENQAYFAGWVGANSDLYASTKAIVWSAITSSTSYLWRNGLLVKSGVGGVTVPNGLVYGANEWSDGDIGEIIAYNRGLTDAERVSVESYLIQKWKTIV